jgi:hypothetical protein
MNNYFVEFIKDFSGKSFEDFLLHIYSSFQKKIELEKTEKLKNKYIKIRTNMMSYIVANKQSIMAQIKNKNK